MGDPASLDALRENVGRFLRASFGDVPLDQDNDFVVRRGEAVAWVRPMSLPPNDVRAVIIWSTTNLDLPVTPELTRFLATEGSSLTFGQFQLHESPTRLNVSHTLLGDFLSREELEVAVEALLGATEHYGPMIKERFGGRLLGEGGPATSRESVVVSEENTAELMDLLMRAEAASRERAMEEEAARRAGRLQTKRVLQALFGLVGMATGVVGAIMAFNRTASWALVIFVFLVSTYLIGRGIPDVITDPHRIRRTLYFLIPPAAATGVVSLAFRWWDRWWLAVLLGLTVGVVIGTVIVAILFPGIAREEMADDAARRRAVLRGG